MVVIEIGLSLALAARGERAPRLDPRADADTYGDSAWVPAFFDEMERSSALRWESYVYWRRRPFSGQFVSVDSLGIRRSIASATTSRKAADRPRIYFFGGSTMWGTGAPDAQTIPSLVLGELTAEGHDLEVVNIGESGYVSTQSVIALLRLLQRGERPDLVVFYDGVNDTFSAYQQGVGGLPQNEANRIAEFNFSRPDRLDHRRAMTLRDQVSALAIVRVLRGTRQVEATMPTQADSSTSDANLGRLVGEVISTYRGNLGILEALGSHYGFRVLAYWQPTILQKRTLSAYEQSEWEKTRHFQRHFDSTYAALRQYALSPGSTPRIHDLSGIFEETSEPVFIDWMHLGGRGNAIVARRIAADAKLLLRKSP